MMTGYAAKPWLEAKCHRALTLPLAVAVVLALVVGAGIGAAEETPSAPAAKVAAEPLMHRVVDQPFEDVVLTVLAAINGQNYRVTGQNDIGGGLQKRGYTDFPDYVVIHFCSLEAARKGLLIDRRLGAIMPCRLAVYQDGDDVVVLLPSARTVLAPLENPELAEFERELDAVYRAILEEIGY